MLHDFLVAKLAAYGFGNKYLQMLKAASQAENKKQKLMK